jgi:hypothetical protein
VKTVHHPELEEEGKSATETQECKVQNKNSSSGSSS